MNLEQRKAILKQHNLRVTDCRLDVLEFFKKATHALSTRELELAFDHYDRVTLYRTLSSFTETGIIHSIPDSSGHARYGLCHETCSSESHNHDHLHFKCDDCGNIECLEGYHVPVVQIPGYDIRNQELILNGTCKSCHS